MGKPDFTPGPWTAEPKGGRGAWVKGATGEWTALSCGDTDERADANAQLIVAAPDLYTAAKPRLSDAAHARVTSYVEAMRAMGDRRDADAISFLLERHDKLQAAVAKAEGRT